MKPLRIRGLRLSGTVQALASLILLALLLGFAGKLWWAFDLCSHFRAQAVAGLTFCVVCLLALRRWKSAVGFAIPALLAALPLIPLPAPSADAADERRFKIISFNVNTANERRGEVLTYLAREAPDLFLLLEVDDEWLKALRPFTATYPHRVEYPRGDNFGIAAYSRAPLVPADETAFGPYGIPVIDVKTEVLGKPTRLLGLHTIPPTSARHSDLRNEQLAHFAKEARQSSGPVIMAGDFNVTPFSPWFSSALTESGLRDSGAGFGFTPTWLRSLPCFALPIDHAWVPDAFTVVGRTIGPALGSDHNPLVLTLGLARPRPQP